MNKLKQLNVSYTVTSMFKIPKKLNLLPVYENFAAPGGTVGSWFVKYNVLHYVDSDGEWKQLHPKIPVEEDDYKRPDSYEDSVESSDDE
jgi:hypothetical protein